MREKEKGGFQADRVLSYFKVEWKVLLAVTVSGLIYNLGLLAGPWFEGRMTGCLVDILNGLGQFSDMAVLVAAYVAAIAVVQISRYIKRFYVRRFANNVNRRMKEVLYGSLVRKSRASLREEGEGTVMTKAILDVDDCVEGMRKFTTEIFDTGVALAAYAGMLLFYDWHLALLCMIFPPISYITAEKMKKMVQRTGAAYKIQSGVLSAATLDRAQNAITYRVFGCEQERQQAYESNLDAYEKSAVKANIWSTAMPPIYRVISMAGCLFILYFGQKNVLGRGWRAWDIASFTTFLACFVKLSVKSSSAAKLFNAVHKAQVSWNRIKGLLGAQDKMQDSAAETKDRNGQGIKQYKSALNKNGQEADAEKEEKQAFAGRKTSPLLQVSHLTFAYPDGKMILDDISFSAEKGQIIGITGPVACGKSTLGKVFLCEYPYDGQILLDGRELQKETAAQRTDQIGYLGHDPELFADSIAENILLGDPEDANRYLKLVCLDQEVGEMSEGVQTLVGNGGVRLSGGQAQRLALARTLCHKKPLLILDDPFSALDQTTEREVFANLKETAKDSMILLFSHRLYLFQELDQVIWMENGRTVAGTHAELMKKVPEYAELIRAEEGERKDEA
ncbi:MAG: ABC transporter ATP-binding protein [Lachnospiraceae bacterium]|nr:ABC transporter ATP-binding protein [Lachnospiraceae bacterium]